MSACGTSMLSGWKPNALTKATCTHSASGGLSTVISAGRVERAVQECVPARAHRAHGGAVVLVRPAVAAQRPQVEERSEGEHAGELGARAPRGPRPRAEALAHGGGDEARGGDGRHAGDGRRGAWEDPEPALGGDREPPRPL